MWGSSGGSAEPWSECAGREALRLSCGAGDGAGDHGPGRVWSGQGPGAGTVSARSGNGRVCVDNWCKMGAVGEAKVDGRVGQFCVGPRRQAVEELCFLGPGQGAAAGGHSGERVPLELRLRKGHLVWWERWPGGCQDTWSCCLVWGEWGRAGRIERTLVTDWYGVTEGREASLGVVTAVLEGLRMGPLGERARLGRKRRAGAGLGPWHIWGM